MNRYRNFELELADYDPESDPPSFSVRVLQLPGRRAQRKSEAAKVSFPDGFGERLRGLERRQLSIEGLIALGEDLAELLLPRARIDGSQRSVRDLYHSSRRALKSGEGLRIQIFVDNPELGELPWEYVYVADPDTPSGRKGRDGFLALDREISIVRYEDLGEPTDSGPRQSEELRVLALLSEVRAGGWAELDLDRDEANLLQALEGVEAVDLTVLRPGTLVDFEDHLTRSGGVEVFHFSGHGKFERRMGEKPGTVEGEGSLILAGADGEPDPMTAEKLAGELNKRDVKLAVLGACEAAKRDPVTPWSGVASALLRKDIPAVVAMQYTVRDGNAVAFSRRFYQALAAGKSIDAAVSEGRLGINQRAGSSERDWGVPVLYLGTDRNLRFPKPMKPLRRNLSILAIAGVLLIWWFAMHASELVSYKLNVWAAWLGIGVGALPLVAAMVHRIASLVRTNWHFRHQDTWIERWLSHGKAPVVAWTALGLAIVLLFSTHSIYLLHNDDAAQVSSVEIAVSRDNAPWKEMPSLQTRKDEGKTLDGGVILFQLLPTDLELVVKRPFGRKIDEGSKKATFGFWPWERSEMLTVPDVLVPDDSRVLRLLMRNSLHQLLPDPPGDPGSGLQYELKVTFGDDSSKVIPLQKGIVYLGTHESVLSNQLQSEGGWDRREGYRSCLPSEDKSDTRLFQWMEEWNPDRDDYRHFVPDSILREGQSVEFEVRRYRLNSATGKREAECIVPTKTIPGADEPIAYEDLRKGQINNICIYKTRARSENDCDRQ